MVPLAGNFYQHLRAPEYVGFCLCVSDNQPICSALAAINCMQSSFQYAFHFVRLRWATKLPYLFFEYFASIFLQKDWLSRGLQSILHEERAFSISINGKINNLCSVFSCKNIPLRIPTKPIWNKYMLYLWIVCYWTR